MSRVRAPAASTGSLARGVDKREVRQHDSRVLPGATRTSGCRRGRAQPGGARPSAGQGSRAQRRVRWNFEQPATDRAFNCQSAGPARLLAPSPCGAGGMAPPLPLRRGGQAPCLPVASVRQWPHRRAWGRAGAAVRVVRRTNAVRAQAQLTAALQACGTRCAGDCPAAGTRPRSCTHASA